MRFIMLKYAKRYNYVYLIFLLAVFASCTSTKRIYIPLENVKVSNDSLYRYQTRTDTIRERDSVSLIMRGDTVYHTRWLLREKVRERHDTIYRALTDTVYVERAVPVSVERSTTFWERLRNNLLPPIAGIMFILFAGICLRRLRFKQQSS